MREMTEIIGGRELVMVSNRLPVDRVTAPDGSVSWRTSPGGLVTAVEPIVEELGCLWIGWAGNADEAIDPFSIGSMRLSPVALSELDIAEYYEGFSNGTLWPLYHDVIAPPEFHREWWERYRLVNQRFAERVAEQAAPGAIVWVHDYQLQLVPAMLRALRPDVAIGFFLHIPFPPARLFSQLPWRKRIVEGLLGADVLGFQGAQDALSFRHVAERYGAAHMLGNTVVRLATADAPAHSAIAQEFPISIDSEAFAAIARTPAVVQRAAEIRAELGNPRTVLLGIDRLDYTKGIPHRLKAFSELLDEGELTPGETVLIQVASPSRERVDAYQALRNDVELTVGRINGDHDQIGRSPLVYMHRSFTRDEMVALYLAADVLMVTPLRDGMNLVAKEYVACSRDHPGVLLLSEFAGAADQLSDAVLVNPHDIEGLKAGILRAIHMPAPERDRRMSALRDQVFTHDVAHWASGYLGALVAAAERNEVSTNPQAPPTEPIRVPTTFVPRRVAERVRRFATEQFAIVACDFDGTLAPIVANPSRARILPRAQDALRVLHEAPGVRVALLSGRSVQDLQRTGIQADDWIVSGSHGAELVGLDAGASSPEPAQEPTPTAEETARLTALRRRFERVLGAEPGIRFEEKPFGIAVHTRAVNDTARANELLAAAAELGAAGGFHVRAGKQVCECTVRTVTKGDALRRITDAFPEYPVLFFGDDVTDEDVFTQLGPNDLGIKVGPGDTAAAERIPDPEAVSAVLAMLAELRTGVVIGSGPVVVEEAEPSA